MDRMVSLRKISEIKDFENICFEAALVSLDLVKKNDGNGEYQKLKFADKTGVLTVPLWVVNNELAPGKAYRVKAMKTSWKGNPQLDNVVIEELKDYKSGQFLESYEMTKESVRIIYDAINKLKQPYKTFLLKLFSIDGDDITLENSQKSRLFSEFMRCPSAEKHHGNKIHGLCYHTIGVIKNALNIICLYEKGEFPQIYGNKISDCVNIDRLIFKAIIHDICKINEYQYDVCIARKNKEVGHIIDGVYLVKSVNHKHNIFSEQEEDNICYSILSHHGEFGPYQPKTLEDTILHISDLIDARVVGEMEQL